MFDPSDGAVYSGGNFYGGHIALAMDSLKVAVASVGDLLDRQLALVVDERSTTASRRTSCARARSTTRAPGCITASRARRSPARRWSPRR